MKAKDIQSPCVIKRSRRVRRTILFDGTGPASLAIGEIARGCEIFGFTKGQFSVSEIIAHCLNYTGPAHINIGTWTAAEADIKHAENLLRNGHIQSIRFVVDPSFKNRQPRFCEMLEMTFPGSIRTINSHAKFVTITNETWQLVIRTSMNLNSNPRMENFEISDDPELSGFFGRIVDEIFENFAETENYSRSRGNFQKFQPKEQKKRPAHPFGELLAIPKPERTKTGSTPYANFASVKK